MLCNEDVVLRVCQRVRFWDTVLMFSTSDLRARSCIKGN